MSNFTKENVKLREAMTMNLEQEFRSWSVDGLQIDPKDYFPEDVNSENVSFTAIMKKPDGKFELQIYNKTTEPIGGYGKDFSSLEEIEEKYPNLFELDGYFYAFP